MTLAIQQTQVEVTPDTITEEQDQLLAAGSKISFRDIYNQEIDIPLHKGKFYLASDVDDLFILINGVLADVSKHAHRNSKALSASRAETQNLLNELSQAAELLDDAETQNKLLEQHIGNLIDSVSNNSLTTIGSDSDQSYEALQQELTDAQNEVEVLGNTLTAVQNNYNKTVSELEETQTELTEVRDAYTRLMTETVENDNSEFDQIVDQLHDDNQYLLSHIDSLEEKQTLLAERNRMLQKLSTL